jgi:hypothetical protein
MEVIFIGYFTIRSMYLDLPNGHTVYLTSYIWELKVPPKIKIFMWFLHRTMVLTKDNLVKTSWHGCVKCYFCHQDETIQHLFITCPFMKNDFENCIYGY